MVIKNIYPGIYKHSYKKEKKGKPSDGERVCIRYFCIP